MAKKTNLKIVPRAAKRTLSLNSEGVAEGIAAHEALKKVVDGKRVLDIALNLQQLRAARTAIVEAVEEVSLKYALLDTNNEPIPNFIDEGGFRLDPSLVDGAWKEGEYAPGRIVYYHKFFYQAEDVTDDKPPSDSWAVIGTIGPGHCITDAPAYHREVREIERVEHEVELYTVPAALLRSSKMEGNERAAWPPVVEFEGE